MFIYKVILNNFRVYQGINEIIFYRDDFKNVVVIAGDNGFGKTTFLTSLVWCLYGKQMSEVDNNYKKAIYEAGGYKNYASSNLNWNAKWAVEEFISRETKESILSQSTNEKYGSKLNTQIKPDIGTYSVTIELDDLNIPSVPCKNVTIKRLYDTIKHKETLEILIDGIKNELTNEVGSELFINDFILPKEIAKFFFFNAETIVSLAELKSLDEKRKLSIAYSEVLGIKKYEDLKANLENLRIRFRRKSASLEDKDKFTLLQKETTELEKLINHLKDKLAINDVELLNKKQLSEQYQEKLIREGNSISLEELISLKKVRDKLKDDSNLIKGKLKEMLDLSPFAISAKLLFQTYNQILLEQALSQKIRDNELFKTRLEEVKENLIQRFESEISDNKLRRKLMSILNNAFIRDESVENVEQNIKILLDFSDQEINEFIALYDNIRYSFKNSIQNIVKEDRNNRIFLNKTVRKISQAESNENDLLIKEIRLEKNKIEKQILELERQGRKLVEEIGAYQRDHSVKSKVITELAKRVSLDESDKKKDEIAIRIIKELDELLLKLKNNKKNSLEIRIKTELNRLFHKSDFIRNVNVFLTEDILDVHLFISDNKTLDKDSLSKGEQQLYATSILKALVDESEFSFPVFIDSPLQKFDKEHAKNVICEFYPAISTQVIIFPLLEKELTEQEYAYLMPRVNQVFILNNLNNSSSLKTIAPETLFQNVI